MGLTAPRAHPLHGKSRNLPRISKFQFFLNSGPMCFHRLWTQMQLFSDVLYFVAFADVFEDFQLAIGQAIRRIRARRILVRTTFVITSLAIDGLR